jgi:hypothetical protein
MRPSFAEDQHLQPGADNLVAALRHQLPPELDDVLEPRNPGPDYLGFAVPLRLDSPRGSCGS